MTKRSTTFSVFIFIAILLIMFLLVGQTVSLFNYELAVSLGLQESIREIGGVGIAFAKGFAFGDTVIYIPLLVGGVIGLLKNKSWGVYSMFGAMAISAYWPLVHLYSINIGASNFHLSHEKYITYSVVLPLISIYGLWGMWYLINKYEK